MNFGTKLRTVLRIAVSLQNTAVVLTASVQAFASEYHIGWLTLTWAIFALLCNFVVDVLTTYYNNDYTVEGSVGTKVTREMKELADTEWIPADEPDDADLEVVEDDNR